MVTESPRVRASWLFRVVWTENASCEFSSQARSETPTAFGRPILNTGPSTCHTASQPANSSFLSLALKNFSAVWVFADLVRAEGDPVAGQVKP